MRSKNARYAGVLLELMCDFKQAKYLAGWFRKHGYGLRVASGDYNEGSKGVRNSVAVFYKLRKFKEAKGDVVGKYKRCVSDNWAAAAMARRRGGSDDGSDTGSTGGGVASEEEEATGRASRGASKRRRDVASYAESEQESEDDEGGGWD